jgi:CBS domain-containing protein
MIIEQQEIIAAPGSTSVIAAACLMRENRVGAVMVVEGGKLAGVFTERDALFRVIAEGRDVRTTQLADVMTRNPQTIHPDKPFADALHVMYEGGFRHVPVVEDDRPVGMRILFTSCFVKTRPKTSSPDPVILLRIRLASTAA